MIDRIVAALEGVLRLNRSTENLLVDVVAAVSPWLAPALPAYLTWYNLSSKLLFPDWVAIVSALVIEFVGLSAISTSLMLWSWNENRREKDPTAPFWLAITSGVFYLAIVLSVNTLLEIDPARFKILVQGLMSCLSVVAGMIIAVRGQHARRLSDREKERIELREERRLARAERLSKVSESFGNLQAPPEPQIVKSEYRDWRKLSPEDKMKVADMKTVEEVEEAFGVSERTAYNWMKSAKSNGFHRVEAN
jgi:hypothetical protein